MNWIWHGVKRPWPIWCTIPIFIGTEERHDEPDQYSRSVGQVSKPGTVDYEAGALTTTPGRSITTCRFGCGIICAHFSTTCKCTEETVTASKRGSESSSFIRAQNS
jgi:hypothetical protein